MFTIILVTTVLFVLVCCVICDAYMTSHRRFRIVQCVRKVDGPQIVYEVQQTVTGISWHVVPEDRSGLTQMLHTTREDAVKRLQQLRWNFKQEHVEQDHKPTQASAETENTMGQELNTANQAEATTEYQVTDDVRLGDAWKKICEICRTHASKGGSGLRVKWVSVGVDPASSDPAEASRNLAVSEYLVAHMRDSGLYVRNYYNSPDSQDFHVSWKRY